MMFIAYGLYLLRVRTAELENRLEHAKEILDEE